MVGVRGTLGVALAVATMLLLACLILAAPAFAEANAQGGTIQYVDCDQVQSAAANQYNAGNTGDAGAIAQDLNIDQDQVLACLDSSANEGNNDNNDNDNNNNNDDDTNVDGDDDDVVTDDSASDDAEDVQSATKDVLADTIVKGVLPDTGGLALPALAGYALVVTGIFSMLSLIGRRR